MSDDLNEVDAETEQKMISCFEDLINDLQLGDVTNATNAVGTATSAIVPSNLLSTALSSIVPGAVMIGGGTVTSANNMALWSNGMGQMSYVDMNPEVKVQCKRCLYETKAHKQALAGTSGYYDINLTRVCPECSIIALKKLGLTPMTVDDSSTTFEWALLRIMNRMGFDKMIKEFGLEDEIEFLLTSQLKDLASAASMYVANQNLVSKPE